MELPPRDAAGLARAVFAMTAYSRHSRDPKDAEAVAVVAQHLLADLETLAETWQRSFDLAYQPAVAVA